MKPESETEEIKRRSKAEASGLWGRESDPQPLACQLNPATFANMQYAATIINKPSLVARVLRIPLLILLCAWLYGSARAGLHITVTSSTDRAAQLISVTNPYLWTITVSNTGPGVETGLSLQARIPQFVGSAKYYSSPQSVSPGFQQHLIHPTPNDATQGYQRGSWIIWAISELGAGQSRVFTIKTQAIDGIEGDRMTLLAELYRGNSFAGSDQKDVTLETTPRFNAQLVCSQTLPRPGTDFELEYALGARQPFPATGVVSITLPPECSVNSATEGWRKEGSVYSWRPGSLVTGEGIIVRMSLRLAATAAPGLPIFLTASVTDNGAAVSNCRTVFIPGNSGDFSASLNTSLPMTNWQTGSTWSFAAFNNGSQPIQNLYIETMVPLFTGNWANAGGGQYYITAGLSPSLVNIYPDAASFGSPYPPGSWFYLNNRNLAPGGSLPVNFNTPASVGNNGDVIVMHAEAWQPSRLLQRVSRTSILDNRAALRAPVTPGILSPAPGQAGVPLTPTFTSSSLVDADGHSHLTSQWLIRASLTQELAYDSGETTVSKNQLNLPSSILNPATDYTVLVRYRDSGRSWSQWSTPVSFRTIAPNASPVISNIPDAVTNEDASTGVIPFTVSDQETAATSLVLSKSTSNTTLVPEANIILGGSGTNRTVTVTPAPNQSGTATITVTVNDGTALSSATFLLTVNEVNDLPAISNITDKTTNEDTATAAISFTVGDVETSAASLTLSSSSSNQSLVPSANVVFGGSGANRTVMVTPAANQSGTSTITVTVNDGTVSVSDTFLLTVTPVNDLPSVSDVVNQAVNEDTATAALSFTIGDLETAVDALTMTKASSNTTLVPVGNIVFTGTGANRFVTVTPAANQSGTATITVTVNDGTATASDTFLVTVTAVNDPPTISGVADRATNEDTATGSIAFTIGDVETSTSSLTVTRASSNTTLVPLTGVVLGGSAASRTVTITPAANQFGASTITLSVSDGSAIVNSTFVLTINPVNDPPVISNVGNFSTNEDTATPAITFSISDVETSATDLVLTGGSSNAVLVSVSGLAFGGTGSNRTVVITPALNQSGTSTITLTVSDGTATASDTFVLTVTAVNDAPTITDIADQTLIRNTSSAAIPFIIGDVETASTSLTVTRTSSNTALLPLSGVVLGGSGSNRSITLTPASNQVGSSTVTVTVSDGSRTASDTFIVTVTNLTPLDQWKQTHFAANANNESIAGDYANPDGDLLINLLEYALGGNPNNPASAPSPLVNVGGGRVSLNFSRIVANSDITITVQGADSLNGPWTDIARSTAGNATIVLAGGAAVTETGAGATRTVEVKDVYAIGDAVHPKRFLRLKVQR